jgi:hypothetical protein
MILNHMIVFFLFHLKHKLVFETIVWISVPVMNFNCPSKISQLHSEILINISPFCKLKTCNNRPAKTYSCRQTPHCSTSVTAAISIKNKLIFGPVPVHVSIWNMSHLCFACLKTHLCFRWKKEENNHVIQNHVPDSPKINAHQVLAWDMDKHGIPLTFDTD